MKRTRVLKFIRNTAISIAVLLVVIIGAGVAYTWYMGQQPVDTTAVATPVEVAPKPTVIKAPKLSPNANVSASIQVLTSPVAPGMNASILVKTNPTSACTIEVKYDEIASTDSGLMPKTADEYGLVEWVWTVEPTVPHGIWPVNVTCVSGEKSAMVRGDLHVTDEPQE